MDPVSPKVTKKYTVLIVEDDPELSRMYKEKFEIEGFEAITAPDGAIGLELAIQKTPDAILLDIMLPKDHGLNLLAKLRQNPKAISIPVIALSNLTEKNQAEQALKLGAKEYLAKAMHSPEEVVNKVKTHIGIS